MRKRGKKNKKFTNSIISVDQYYIPMQFYSRRDALKAIGSGRAKLLDPETWEKRTKVCNNEEIKLIVFEHTSLASFNGRVTERKLRTKDLLKSILDRDKYKCIYCLDKATTVDHVIPVSKGGTTVVKNLVAACLKCNQLKGNKSVEEVGFSFKFEIQTPRKLLFDRFEEITNKGKEKS